jgi:hypothetical protein
MLAVATANGRKYRPNSVATIYPAELVSASYTCCEHKRKVKSKMLRYIVFYLKFEVKFGLKVCGQI